MAVIANDFQIPFHHKQALKLFMRFLKHEQPDWLILNGDFQDFWEISTFDQTPRGGEDLNEEIAAGKDILKSFRWTLPKARITWLEGNHEFRLRKYLMRNAKELYGFTSLTVPELFGLQNLKIDYVRCKPASSKFTDNFIRVGNLYVGHWDLVSKHSGYAAKGLVDEKGVSLLQGHTHRFGAHAKTTLDGHVLLGVENFAMCARGASYVSYPNWQLGFSVVYFDPSSGRFQWYPVLFDRHGFVWNGQEYRFS